MSAALSSSDLLDALRRWHVPVRQVARGRETWNRHNRAGHGAWGDMHGVLNHHTGPYSNVTGMAALLWDGRSDLPGPLCNIGLAPDGVAWLIGWGRANHAGSGDADVYAALLADQVPPRPDHDSVDGNAVLYGIEVMHPGDSSPYPDAQIESLVRINAAILEHHGWTEASSLQHSEWTYRKVDMSWHRPNAGPDLRAEIARALRQGPDVYRFSTAGGSGGGHSLPSGVHPPVPAPTPAPKPARYPVDHVLYARRGTPDYGAASWFADAAGRDDIALVVTADAAKAAHAAGAHVIAVGGPACADVASLSGVTPVNGATAIDTGRQLAGLAL